MSHSIKIKENIKDKSIPDIPFDVMPGKLTMPLFCVRQLVE